MLEVAPDEGLALADGAALSLSALEVGLLAELVRHEGRIHTHVGFGYRFAAERSHDFHSRVTAR